MYSILIADDEPIHRRGIVSMISRLRPDYTLFEARDGVEALDILDSQEIDIMITDIKMPNVDGFQLIERLGARLKNLKVIILSAYGYFEYAKKAITLGAFDYILKPIEETDIEETIHQVEESIERDRIMIQEKIYMENRLSHTVPIYIEHLLTKLVGDGLNKTETDELEKIIPPESRCVIAVSEIDKKQIFGAGAGSVEAVSSEIDFTFKYLFDESLRPLGNTVSFFQRGNRNLFVSIIYTEADQPLDTGLIVESVNAFINQIKHRFHLESAFGISETCPNIFSQIRLSYGQAMSALLHKFYYGSGKAICFQEIPFDDRKTPFSVYAEEDALAEVVQQLSREKAELVVDRIFDKLTAGGYQPPQRVKENVVYFIMNQIKRSENLLLKEQYNSLLEQAETVVANSPYFEDLKSKTKEIVLLILSTIENRKNNKNSAIIQKCKDYIEGHFMDDIPLDEMAKKFYFSPAYFSSFFKNYTGIGFSEYILKTRMKNAKELLIRTDEKIYDIAAKVGYKDQGYFTKIFKRETGAAPEEFRRNSGIYEVNR